MNYRIVILGKGTLALLFTTESVSNFHRLKSDEIWHFHKGGAAKIHFISEEGAYSFKTIGADFENKETLQVVIPMNTWFAAEVIKDDFILVGCTVAPGFEFQDFELAKRNTLGLLYPEQAELIKRFTRS
jgi:predicted cupin superfamily sugar epimerase